MSGRGIDHLVLAARDLDAQAALYRRLGFTVGARNRHSWGTLNHIIQFPGSFLELITTEPSFVAPRDDEPVAQFARPLAERLAVGDGMTQLVLESRDAAADLRSFSAHGIAGGEIFFFERRGKRPDGSDVHVAFTLAFARAPTLPECAFFVSQQHVPENFWNPAFQSHRNGVTAVSGVVIVAPVVADTISFLAGFIGTEAARRADGSVTFETPRGRIEVMTPHDAASRLGLAALPADRQGAYFAAVRLRTGNPADITETARSAGVTSVATREGVVVPARAAHGVALVFEP